MNITSLTNPKIKQLVKLRNRKVRQETGVTMIDGIRELTRAYEAGVALSEIYLCPALVDMKKFQGMIAKGTTVYEVPEHVFEKISFGARREGVLALAQPQERKLLDLLKKKDPLFVVVENVEKPGNLGAILRTCDGAGVDALIVSDPTTEIYSPNVIRASLGTVFSVPVVQASTQETIEFLKQQKCRTLAATPQAKTVYTDADCQGALAIVLGSEQTGLSDLWIQKADQPVKIPMRGQADSLNVSVTAAVLVFEALRQREGKK